MPKPNQSLQINQSNLQDFLDCPRRFQLKVIQGLSLPAAYSEPIGYFEKATLLGNRFHLICQQFFSGIDPVLLEIAKYDLIVKIKPEQYLIIDWKTAAKISSRSKLDKRLQTHLYPYVFSQSGNDLFPENSISPGFIEMHYWYPLASDHEEVFPYSDNKDSHINTYLEEIISKINTHISSGIEFSLTDDKSTCQYCVFRSLCNRGTSAGPIENSLSFENEDLTNVQFDIDQVSEIEF